MAMNDDAARAAAHRIADEAVAIQPLTLERDKNRSSLDLARVGHDFAESLSFALTDEPAAGRHQDFISAPRHSPIR